MSSFFLSHDYPTHQQIPPAAINSNATIHLPTQVLPTATRVTPPSLPALPFHTAAASPINRFCCPPLPPFHSLLLLLLPYSTIPPNISTSFHRLSYSRFAALFQSHAFSSSHFENFRFIVHSSGAQQFWRSVRKFSPIMRSL